MKKFTKIASLIMAIAIVASTLIIFPATHDHVHAAAPNVGDTYTLENFGTANPAGKFTMMSGSSISNLTTLVANKDGSAWGQTGKGYFKSESDAASAVLFVSKADGKHHIKIDNGTLNVIAFTAETAGTYKVDTTVSTWGASGGYIYVYKGTSQLNKSAQLSTSDGSPTAYTFNVGLLAGETAYVAFTREGYAAGDFSYVNLFNFKMTYVSTDVTVADGTEFVLNQKNLTTNSYYSYFNTTGAADAPDWSSKNELVNATSGCMYGHSNESGVGITANKVVLTGCDNGASFRIDTPQGTNHTLINFKAPACGTYTASFKTGGAGWNGDRVSMNYWVGNDTDGYVKKSATSYAIGTSGTYALDIVAAKGDYIVFDIYSTIDAPLNNVAITTTYRSETHVYSDATCKALATCRGCGKTDGTYSTTNHESTETYYYDLGNNTHGKKFECCDGIDTSFTPEAHKGGTATCLAKAECEVCGVTYGNTATHTIKYKDLTSTTHTAYCDFDGCDHEDQPANHDWNNGACGTCNYQCQHDFTGGGACTYGCGTDHQHSGGEATCESPAICDVCSQPYGAKDADNHTSTTIIYTSYDENGHVAALKCCGQEIPTDVAHVYDADGLCACGYQCPHTSSTTANCVDKSTCTQCGKEMAGVDADNHKSEDLEWTKTETHHSAVHACCKAEAVANAEHTLVEGKCSVCEKVIENALGSKYTFDLSDLGSTTDKFDFFTASSSALSDLTKLEKVIAAGENGGWGVDASSRGIVKKNDTLLNYFWVRGDNPTSLIVKTFGLHQVIAFKAPVNGVYTFNIKGHAWGNENQIHVRVIRQGEGTPKNTYDFVGSSAAAVNSASIELAKGEYLYFDFYADGGVNNYVTLSSLDVTLTKKLNKAPDKIVDVADRIDDFASFPGNNFNFYVMSGIKNTDNPSPVAMNSLNKHVLFSKSVDVKYGDWKGFYLDVEGGSINQFTAGYSDIQFMQSHESDLGLLVAPNKGEVLIIKYVVPADGKYSYTISARDLSAASNCAVMDVKVRGGDWWDMMRISGAENANYVATQNSSQKALKKGDEIYFLFRVAGADATVINISDFAVIQHGVRVPATGDNFTSYAIAALVLISGAALVIGKKRRNIEK